MATTYTQIANTTVGSGGSATIDLTSITSDYNDLVLKLTTRDTAASANTGAVKVTFNSSSTGYTNRNMYGNGDVDPVSGSIGTTYIDAGLDAHLPTAGNTTNTFSNIEIYITNYAGNQTKSVSIDVVGENNAVASFTGISAGSWANSSAITSISIAPTTLFAQHSTATLYGIKNS
jgi:hypothetical protein